MNNAETVSLEIFAEYTKLHMTGAQLLMNTISSAYGPEVTTELYDARMSNLKEATSSTSPKVAAGVTVGGTKLIFDTARHMRRALSVEGWTVEEIKTTLSYPAVTKVGATNMATGNPATVYYRSDGQYIVVDNMTGEIFHVSNTNSTGWIDPFGEPLRDRP
jgi:hypothetical protein